MKIKKKAALLAGSVATLGAVAIGSGTAYAVASSAPAPTPLIGCVTGSSRTLEHVYTSPASFMGCPKGSIAVQSGATGPRGLAGSRGATGARGPQGPAGPSGAGGSAYRTEVDNGTEWTLSPNPIAGDVSTAGATYADAGVVVDAGELNSQLTTGSFAYDAGSNVSENLWIGDGPEASVPGTHPLSDSADFFYASYQGTGMFSVMAPGASGLSGTVSLAQIKAAYGNGGGPVEAYIWAGVTSSGANVPPVTIHSVDGVTVNSEVGIQTFDSNKLFAFVRPL